MPESFDDHRPLYLMAKLPPAVAAMLATKPCTDRQRIDRLHLTLLPLGDRMKRPGLLGSIASAMADFEDVAFWLAFDCISRSAKTVALTGSEAIRGARRLQANLRTHLIRRDVALPRYSFRPHITLAYRPDGVGTEIIDTISWLADEVLLIESVHGKGLHIEHGRWRLAPPLG